MHDAAEAGSNEIVCMLLNAGAKNVKDDCSMTPMQCAALAGHEDVLMSLSAVATAQETRDALKVCLQNFLNTTLEGLTLQP